MEIKDVQNETVFCISIKVYMKDCFFVFKIQYKHDPAGLEKRILHYSTGVSKKIFFFFMLNPLGHLSLPALEDEESKK